MFKKVYLAIHLTPILYVFFASFIYIKMAISSELHKIFVLYFHHLEYIYNHLVRTLFFFILITILYSVFEKNKKSPFMCSYEESKTPRVMRSAPAFYSFIYPYQSKHLDECLHCPVIPLPFGSQYHVLSDYRRVLPVLQRWQIPLH